MKNLKTLLFCGFSFLVLSVSGQTEQTKSQEKKINQSADKKVSQAESQIKQANTEREKQLAELQASIWENPTKALQAKKWALVSYLADGIPPGTFMNGESFPKGTEFIFGAKGLGFTQHNGVRISNFNWKANKNVLTLEYVVMMPDKVTMKTEKDEYTILSLLPDQLVIATQFDQEMKAKIKLQQEAVKLNINDMTTIILGFVPAE